MTNETENIQNSKTEAETKRIEINTILDIAANVGDEQTLKMLCDCLDLNFDELKGQIDKIQEENNLNSAKKVLDGVVPEGEPIIEEPVEE